MYQSNSKMYSGLTPAMSQLSAALLPTLTGPARPKIEYGVDLYLLGQGLALHEYELRFDIPFGAEPKDYHAEVKRRFKEELLSTLNLFYARVTDETHIIHSEQELLGRFSISYSSTAITLETTAPDLLLLEIKKFFETQFDTNPAPIVRRICLDGDGDLKASVLRLPDRPATPASVLMYPYFDFTPQQLWEEFAQSKSNVLLLIGPPGVGKSSFILEMMHARGWKRNVYVADHDQVLMHNRLADYIRNVPKGSVVITEDSDKMVARRQDGNTNMAALLNATAGIIPTDTKIIISTNLPNLRQVDEALLRPGRAFKILEFRPLTIEEATRLRDNIGLEPADFGGERTVTLAEAFNWHEVNDTNRRPKTIGFLG